MIDNILGGDIMTKAEAQAPLPSVGQEEKLRIYVRIMGQVSHDPDKADLLQSACLTAIEKGLEFNDSAHWANFLRGYIRRKQVTVRQDRHNLASLSDRPEGWIETAQSAYVSVPTDNHLYQMIASARDSRGHLRLDGLARQVFDCVYLQGYTSTETGTRLGLSVDQVDRLRARVNRVVLSLPLRDNLSRWYNGSGATSAQIWPMTDVEPTKIKRDNESGRRRFDPADSARCQKAHRARLDKLGPAMPSYLMDGNRPSTYEGSAGWQTPHRPRPRAVHI